MVCVCVCPSLNLQWGLTKQTKTRGFLKLTASCFHLPANTTRQVWFVLISCIFYLFFFPSLNDSLGGKTTITTTKYQWKRCEVEGKDFTMPCWLEECQALNMISLNFLSQADLECCFALCVWQCEKVFIYFWNLPRPSPLAIASACNLSCRLTRRFTFSFRNRRKTN